MRTVIESARLGAENRYIFSEAQTKQLDGLTLDFHRNTLDQLPARNYYALQALKTGVAIAGVTLDYFIDEPLFNKQNENEVLQLLSQALEITNHLKSSYLLIPLMEASAIKEEKDLLETIRRLRFACVYGLDLKVNLVLRGDFDEKTLAIIKANLDDENVVIASDCFGQWHLT